MLQIIDQFPNTLKAPYPSIYVDKLDNNSINLILRFWIDSKDDYYEMKSNVTETVNLAFKKG
jgi:small-conductance mechanosensitive channel